MPRLLREDAEKKGVGPRSHPRHRSGVLLAVCMVFPAKRFCSVPSMEGVRWAFSCGTWLPSRAEWLLAVRSIQPEEKERIGQFVFARDAKAAMVLQVFGVRSPGSRCWGRKLVAEKLNIPWNNIRLQRTAKGKPVLAKDSLNPYPNFNFNISHQGDYAVLAAEPELQVGIDVMKTSFPGRGSIPEFFHIMKRKFTNKEWETIRSFKDEWTQLDTFYRNWALKESFIKAIGVGLGFELQRLEFDISPLNLEIGQVYKETRLFLDGEEEKEWVFEESKIDEHHFVAVALRKPDGSRHTDVPSQDESKPSQRQFTILTFNDLISSAVPMTPEDPSFWDCFYFTEEILIRNGTKS
ncbi:L-aminoadipate-semialdehyde dehydrogenase-phosphopantetheinyl transferase [Fukomys damarensis]|uniref:L-aminoadipate-semialdehyde dehydrogenase-phosphopantetheinyl transferase n=1 Tax=Fukomys damarensis TaxID=885580 RepID=A0A091D577_FUKDA|nr:L-aminoadipate-semialdehyde dehydrogenase-phosphopantetheinyl transferase [Fukomys damarensis]